AVLQKEQRDEDADHAQQPRRPLGPKPLAHEHRRLLSLLVRWLLSGRPNGTLSFRHAPSQARVHAAANRATLAIGRLRGRHAMHAVRHKTKEVASFAEAV